jgi:hypothetical protein
MEIKRHQALSSYVSVTTRTRTEEMEQNEYNENRRTGTRTEDSARLWLGSIKNDRILQVQEI